MVAFEVGEPPEQAPLDRAAPATLRHRGGVAGAEASLAHRALPLEAQRACGSAPTASLLVSKFRCCQRVAYELCERFALLRAGDCNEGPR
jgi:hypothetical protein